VPTKRGPLDDLRRAARGPITKHRLAEVLVTATSPQPTGAKLWLAERWPWTTGTESAVSTRRPRWAVGAIDLATLTAYAGLDAEAAVREMNRDHDPWPAASKTTLPTMKR
jgi:hypothetical protein